MYIRLPKFNQSKQRTLLTTTKFQVSHPRCVDQLYNQKVCIKNIWLEQLYIITQNSTYYMFRPCILAVVRLYYMYYHTEQYIQLHVSALYIGSRQVVLYILSHRIVHTTTCFGPVYWQSSGCIIYIITQNSTYSYMFRPCILAIVRLYYKLNKQHILYSCLLSI